MRVDKKLYWAWNTLNPAVPDCEPPTIKVIRYAEVTISNNIKYKIACGVFDDCAYTELHTEEISWLKSIGAKIEYL